MDSVIKFFQLHVKHLRPILSKQKRNLQQILLGKLYRTLKNFGYVKSRVQKNKPEVNNETNELRE